MTSLKPKPVPKRQEYGGKTGEKPGYATPKPVRKVSARYLKNAGLYYVQRYSASEQRLKRVLMRKVDRSIRAYGGEREEFARIVDGLVAEFARLSYVDDERFAVSKARRLLRAGNSAKHIRAKLGIDGINRERIERAMTILQEDAGGSGQSPEWKAAWSFARKKRLGPYRAEDVRGAYRQKDAGAMARRGFGSGLVYQIIDAEEIPGEMEVLASGALGGFA